MVSLPNHETTSEFRFNELVDEITRKLQGGERVDLESYIQKLPAYSDRLRQIWPGLLALAELGGSNDPEDLSVGSSSEISKQLLNGTLGDFRLIREIGRGGMGVVYEAEQISLNRRVALKILPMAAMLDPRQLQRFQNEARAAAGLHHPNIVPVHSVGSDRGVHYYAMQYIEGRTLAEVMAELQIAEDPDQCQASAPLSQIVDQLISAPIELPAEGERPDFHPTHIYEPEADELPGSDDDVDAEPPKSPQSTKLAADSSTQNLARSRLEAHRSREYLRNIAQLGIQIAEALDYAHTLGITHRDIKPSNLLLDGRGTVWIADFGLAQVGTEGNLTLTGELLGTLRYMSPEQASGNRGGLDHRTDVYSLGITLYELLTLKPAFPSTDRKELLLQVLNENPRLPRELNTAIPRDLETIILKAIANDPNSRYPTAKDLADDIRCFLDHKPIRAQRPTVWEKSSKWIRRHQRAAIAAIFVVLLFLVTTTAVSMSWAERESVARENAERERNAARIARAEEAHQRKLAVEKRNLAEQQEALAQQQTRRAERNKYLSDIRLARKAWEIGSLGEAYEALEACIPKQATQDLRGWEWHYLWSLVNRSQTVLVDEDTTAWDAQELKAQPLTVWAPDGVRLASLTSQGEIHIWDVPSERRLLSIPGDENGPAGRGDLVWSPDGTQIATNRDNGRVTVWDVSSGQATRSFHLPGARFPSNFSSLAWSSDGSQISIPHWDGSIHLWNPGTNEVTVLPWTWSHPGVGAVPKPIVAWSADGANVALFDGFQSLIPLWEPRTGTVKHVWNWPVGFPCSLAMSPDSNELAVAGTDGTVRIWDLNSGKVRLTFTLDADNRRPSIKWSPTGERIALHWNGIFELRDPKTGHRIQTFRAQSNRQFSWNPDGKQIATTYRGEIRIYDFSIPQEYRLFNGHVEEIRHIAWSGDSGRFASADKSGVVRVWDVAKGRQRFSHTFNHGVQAPIALSSDGRFLFVPTNTRAYFHPSPEDPAPNFRPGIGGQRRSNATTVHLLPDQTFLIDTETISVWDVEAGQPSLELSNSHVVAFHPQLAKLAIIRSSPQEGEPPTRMEIWDVSQAKRLNWMPIEVKPYYQLAWSPDGSLLAVTTQDGLFVLDPATLRLTKPIPGTERVKGQSKSITRPLRWHPSGESVAYFLDGSVVKAGKRERLSAVCVYDVRSQTNMTNFEIRKHGLGSIRDFYWNPEGDGLVLDSQPASKLVGIKQYETQIARSNPPFKVALLDVETGELTPFALSDNSWNTKLVINVPLKRSASVDWRTGAIALGDTTSLEKILELPDSKHDSVFHLAWSPDGKYLASSGGDGSLRLWDTGEREVQSPASEWPTEEMPDRAATLAELGVKMFLSGQSRHGISALEEAVRIGEQLAKAEPDVFYYRRLLVTCNIALGHFLTKLGHHEQASTHFERAVAIAEGLVPDFEDVPFDDLSNVGVGLPHRSPKEIAANSLNDYAWTIGNSPNLNRRDSQRALEMSRRAVEFKPGNGSSLNTLGVCEYRAGNWVAARDALQKSIELPGGENVVNYLFMAMTLKQLKDDAGAQQWFTKAVERMSANQSNDPELNLFFAEARRLQLRSPLSPAVAEKKN